MALHSNLTDPELHEPKGVSSALIGKVYVSDGNGSGSWAYVPSGWGYYKHGGSAQVFDSTYTKLLIDGTGSGTNSDFLPHEIRGSGELWDSVSDRITPINVGDAYSVRLDFPVSAKTGSPTELTAVIDIGGTGLGPTTIVFESSQSTAKTPPFTLTTSIPIFTLNTFLANGGDVYLKTDTGSLTIANAAVLISMTSNGEL